ncbi:MAG TPA: ABC transporter ATP-binding protein [Candidatus Ventrousia excrementavium]|uniref:ABC transporter ATP-binding protein n=1 Tax=Candidatus Ventrousia excrementavium TaxID=2840961 RepID=A0A9D1IU52_9CLOT|nr:ABC transporter ATP-binding protein [Candidatus Ventrousia excrementavium]
MLRLFRYLRQSVWAVAAIFILLVLQAWCDLSLPQYTSDIVDIGIQQGGIENAVPLRIRQSTLDALELFLTDEQIALADASYVPDGDGVLQLDADAEAVEALNAAFEAPMAVLSGISEDTQAQADFSAAVQSGSVDREQLRALAAEALAALGDSADALVSQRALLFVRSEYEALGMDLSQVQTSYLLRTGGQMLGITLLMVATAIGVSFLASRIGARIGLTLRDKVFSKVVSFSSAEIDRFSTASLITRSTNDIQQVQTVIVMSLRIVLYAPILGIGGVFKVMETRTGMTWIIGVGVACVMALVAVLISVAMPKFKKVQALIDRVNLISREILTGLPVIRAFSRERHEEQRFDGANRDLMRTQLFTGRVMTLMLPAMNLLMNGVSVLIVWVGAQRIDMGAMQVGDMIAFITYTMQIVMSFLMISVISVMLPRAGVAAGRINEVIDMENTIRDPEHPRDGEKPLRGIVRFEDVSFRYPDSEADVLEHISFTARPGETTAIIGSTGSGKSTLLNLIPRFFDVTSGRITLDGIDIRELTQHKLRSLLGYVPQKGVLFSGDIESNLKFGGDQITDEQMKQAAAIAQATEFIDQKPDKYHSPIAQGGSNVSGGQKQRLSIARAIAKDPLVYLFDDSFSALDYKTDAALRHALEAHTKDAAVIIVAQRVSTIMHAHQILVLDEGRVAGMGTHEELLRTCAEYQEIAKSQLSESELGGMQS